jgi:hypothetical protein
MRAVIAVGWLQVLGRPAKSYKCTQLTPKTFSVVVHEDGSLTPETCRGSTHNKVIVKVELYLAGYVILVYNDTRSTECYVIVIHNDTRSTKRQIIDNIH